MKAEGLLQKAKIQTALWLPWDVVGELISSMLERLLNRPFTARAEYCDVDYWCCEFGQNYLDLNTQERLFMAMEATEAERQGTIAYCDEQNEVRLPIHSLGMEVSQKILLMSLALEDVEGVPFMKKGLWVIHNHPEEKDRTFTNMVI